MADKISLADQAIKVFDELDKLRAMAQTDYDRERVLCIISEMEHVSGSLISEADCYDREDHSNES